MSPTLNSTAATSLRSYIDTLTLASKPSIPGAILHITDSQNNILFSHASGGASSSSPLSSNTLCTIHSVTKIIGAIAFLQLVDQNLVSLDDTSLIPTHLPELASKKILTGSKTLSSGEKEWIFEDRRGDITPRMLMNHTYGGGHSFFNALLLEYRNSLPGAKWAERNEANDFWGALMESPLLWQPGEHANYGQGFDWIAVLVERVTKKSLADLLHEGIFGVLGLQRTGFEGQYGGGIAAGQESGFWPRSAKTGEGFVAIDPQVLEKVEREDAFPKGDVHVHPLGSGLVSSVADVARVLSILLPQNAGVDPVSGQRILSAEAVREITSPQLPEGIRNDTRNVPTAVPAHFYLGDLQSEHVDPEGSWGLGCGVQGQDRVLKEGKKGRSKGSVYWFGAANTQFWVDGKKGVVVVVNGNYLPWNDHDWIDFVAGVEGRIYEGLEA